MQRLSPATQLSLLKVSASRLRRGDIVPGGHQILSGTVADYLLTVVDEISGLGGQDHQWVPGYYYC